MPALFLDQLADHFDGLGRAVAVVERDELDHAAVDAATVIDALPVGFFALADHTVGRRRPAVGVGVTDLDLLVGRAASHFFCASATPDADNIATVETPPTKLRLVVFKVASTVCSLWT
jgi:hypothetical protein